LTGQLLLSLVMIMIDKGITGDGDGEADEVTEDVGSV
jgi:hypothetical protein